MSCRTYGPVLPSDRKFRAPLERIRLSFVDTRSPFGEPQPLCPLSALAAEPAAPKFAIEMTCRELCDAG